MTNPGASAPIDSPPPGSGLFARLAESRLGLGAAVALLAVLAYGNTILHQFAFDDLATIQRNALLRSDHFWRAFFSADYFWMSGEATFRPLVTLSYWLEHRAFGYWAGGYHATNVALHALNVVLLFRVAAPWFSSPAWGAVAAGILAIHTAGAEAVNGISFREDLLVATLILMAWLALRRAVGSQRIRPGSLSASVAFYLLACLAKESGLVFAALAAMGMRAGLFSAVRGQPLPLRRSLVALNWLMAAALLFLWIWGWWMSNPTGRPHLYFGGSRLIAAYNVPAVYAHHFRRLLWPAGFQADYLFNADPSITGLRVQSGMALFILALCAVAYLFERAPRVGFGLVWMVVTLLPVSNLVPLFNPVADRYLYLPLIGFAISLTAAAEALWRRVPAWNATAALVVRRGMALAGVVAAAVLVFATTQRNLVWGSDERLWSETILHAPESWRALYRLGDYYRAQAEPRTSLEEQETRRQLLGRAEQFLRKAKSLAPHHPDIRNALGNVFLMEGRIEEAIQEYRASLYLYPRNPTACINLCQAYAHRDPPNYDLAAYYLRQAGRLGLEVDPEYRSRILALRRANATSAPSQREDASTTSSTALEASRRTPGRSK